MRARHDERHRPGVGEPVPLGERHRVGRVRPADVAERILARGFGDEPPRVVVEEFVREAEERQARVDAAAGRAAREGPAHVARARRRAAAVEVAVGVVGQQIPEVGRHAVVAAAVDDARARRLGERVVARRRRPVERRLARDVDVVGPEAAAGLDDGQRLREERRAREIRDGLRVADHRGDGVGVVRVRDQKRHVVGADLLGERFELFAAPPGERPGHGRLAVARLHVLRREAAREARRAVDDEVVAPLLRRRRRQRQCRCEEQQQRRRAAERLHRRRRSWLEAERCRSHAKVRALTFNVKRCCGQASRPSSFNLA